MPIRIPSSIQFFFSKIYEKCHTISHPLYRFDVDVMLLKTLMCFNAEIMINPMLKIGKNQIQLQRALLKLKIYNKLLYRFTTPSLYRVKI